MKESYEQEEVILGIDFIRSFGQNWKEEGYIKGILHFGHKTYERKDIYMNNLFRKLFSFTFVFILLMTFCILPTIASAGTRVISQISPTHRVVLNTFKSSEATSTIGRSHLETYKNTKYTSVGVHRQYSSGSDTAWSMSVGQRAQFNDLFGIPGNYGNTAGTSRTYNLTLPAQKKISFYSYRKRITYSWKHTEQVQNFDAQTNSWVNVGESTYVSTSYITKVYTDYGYTIQ